MPINIEVRAFGKLHFLFKKRKWDQPMVMSLPGPVRVDELRKMLEIPEEDVEVVFINHLIAPLASSITDGDRIAFVPPGYPSIHRFNLGFYGARKKDTEIKGEEREKQQ